MPGFGLLLLRTAIGVISVWQGAGLIANGGSGSLGSAGWLGSGGWLESGEWLGRGAGLTAILAGAALIAGLLTPCAAALVAIGAVLSAPFGLAQALTHGLVSIDALSLILLGPGAYSIDARLFGRREIHIRESYRAPRE